MTECRIARRNSNNFETVEAITRCSRASLPQFSCCLASVNSCGSSSCNRKIGAMPITTKAEHDENGPFLSFRSLKLRCVLIAAACHVVSGIVWRFPNAACLPSDMCPRPVVLLLDLSRGLLPSVGFLLQVSRTREGSEMQRQLRCSPTEFAVVRQRNVGAVRCAFVGDNAATRAERMGGSQAAIAVRCLARMCWVALPAISPWSWPQAFKTP